MGIFFICRTGRTDRFKWGYVHIADRPLDALKRHIRKRCGVEQTPPQLAGVHDMGNWMPRSCPDPQWPGRGLYTVVQFDRCGPNLLIHDQALRDYINACHQFGRVRLAPELLLLIEDGG